MRTLKDFTSTQYGNYYRLNQMLGPISSTKFGSSCALRSDSALTNNLWGIQLAEFAEKHTEKVTTKPDCVYKLVKRSAKLRNGRYLHIEAIQLRKGKSAVAKAPTLTRTKAVGSSTNSILSVAVFRLGALAETIKRHATAEERAGIKKEMRELVRGKDVAAIIELTEDYGDYYKRYLAHISEVFGILDKKPKLQFNFNNTVHPRNVDYLTFQLFRY